MSAIAELLLMNLLAYAINLASNERSSAIGAARTQKFKEALEKDEALRKALASMRSIRDEIRDACVELARNRTHLGVTQQEEPLWQLLSDGVFQADLTEWLMAGGIEEGNAVKDRLLRRMEAALANGDTSPEQIAFLKNGYFDALENTIFVNPVLAHWRHQLSLDYLREQVSILRQRAEEAAGVYSLAKQKTALDRYCAKALAVWDIIDLSNLPEGDIQIATQKLLLRQLYMPLRIEVEPTKLGEPNDAALARLEEQREARRHREAGHLFADVPDRPDRQKLRVPIGECLKVSRRVVVLGEPGGGKTTMLRWIATSYLLRQKGDEAFAQIPDTKTLPNQSLIPVLIRCRDLGEADLCRCFTDFLTQHLNKTELLPEDADVMRAVILDQIANGNALLLVDGLDEITNPHVRMMFCQELERTAARYPNAPIVVTSRIVGYRDMPYHMGSGFEHGQIAELNREDKDLFAQRWVDVTEQHQPPAEKAKRAKELLDALHSSDRIERLTGNPMLLTTLALVKRKVGKLPNRRNKLYTEAVSVLLNWNPRLYQTIEEDEAIPQLEYLAYEMCRRGVQRLTDDEVLDLLENVRKEYPNIRAIRRREPQAFLSLLEARSSILIKSGGVWQKNQPEENPVWEFRHLTFQEYLAARALLDGRYPGRDKTKSLADQVAPLAGTVQKSKRRGPHRMPEDEMEVPESWREVLRLLVADCKDDDVDNVVLAIQLLTVGEDPLKTVRPRAVLAALCLSDEPNVSEETANKVIAAFVHSVRTIDGNGTTPNSLESAAIAVGTTIWAPTLKKHLIEEFTRRPADARWHPGSVWGMVEVAGWDRSSIDPVFHFTELVQRLKSPDVIEEISASMTVMWAAYSGKAILAAGLIDSLLALLAQFNTNRPLAHAAAWALGWLAYHKQKNGQKGKAIWLPNATEVNAVVNILQLIDKSEIGVRRWLVTLLGESGMPAMIEPILNQLSDPDPNLRRDVIAAIENLANKKATPSLLAKLNDPDANIRKEIILLLNRLGDKQAVPSLLAKLDDPDTALRKTTIEVLGHIGNKQAIPPLLAMLDNPNQDIGVTVAAALNVLGEPKAKAALTHYLNSQEAEVRQNAVNAYSIYKDLLNRRLLSRSLDASPPWLDPQEPITDDRVNKAMIQIDLSLEKVRSLYESLAVDLNLKLTWKT
jgi:hypothetical protein